MNSARSIRVHAKKDTENVDAVSEAMRALNRATNSTPVTRLEQILIALVATQGMIGVGVIGIAVAILTLVFRGHP